MKKISVVIVLLLSVLTSKACDVCGCQLGGLSMGLLAGQQNNYFGLRYNYAQFHSAIEYNSIYTPNEYADDRYMKFDFTSRINFSDRFWLNLIVPYVYNQMTDNGVKSFNSGISDPIALLNYKLLELKNDSLETKHFLSVGAGFKAPLGNSNATMNNETINPNFQAGSGSWDFVGALNYGFQYKKYGVFIENSAKINTVNEVGYYFGNQYSSSLSLYGWWSRKAMAIVPFVGGYFEKALQHKQDGIIQYNTGGMAFFGNVGFQFYWNSWMLNGLFQLPIYQEFITDPTVTIESKSRFQLEVRYNFKRWKR